MFAIERYNDDEKEFSKNSNESFENNALKRKRKNMVDREESKKKTKRVKTASINEEEMDDEEDDELALTSISLGPVEGAELALSSLIQGTRKRKNEIEKKEEEGAIAFAQEAKEWNLDPLLIESLERRGVSTFFPIQRKAVPFLLKGNGIQLL